MHLHINHISQLVRINLRSHRSHPSQPCWQTRKNSSTRNLHLRPGIQNPMRQPESPILRTSGIISKPQMDIPTTSRAQDPLTTEPAWSMELIQLPLIRHLILIKWEVREIGHQPQKVCFRRYSILLIRHRLILWQVYKDRRGRACILPHLMSQREKL